MVDESGMDLAAHLQTYDGFLAVAKWAVLATAIIVAIVVLLIS